MAKDKERRKNFWDEEEDDAQTGVGLRRPGGTDSGVKKAEDSEAIDQKINETRVLLEQTHQLYIQYFNGFEKRTPIEKLRLLETKIGELQRIGTNLTTARFKIQQFLSLYTTTREMWERKLRELERKRK